MQQILDMLRSYSAPNVFNPWCEADPMDLIPRLGPVHRGERLRAHFDCDPEFLLIGEAPGYQGCHFSGVPFTSELLVTTGQIPRVEAEPRFTTRKRPWSEPSATIVWRTLHWLGIAKRTVLWNAFAWHPHRRDEPLSNRAPRLCEIKRGADVLDEVLRLFRRARYVAVGNVAGDLLGRIMPMNDFVTVRHPSMGGATKFREQMRALVAGEAA